MRRDDTAWFGDDEDYEDEKEEDVEKALTHATERLERDFTAEAYDEQQRLKQAQHGLKQRLAHLAGTD